MEVTYRLSHPLLYLIQQTAKIDRSDILAEIQRWTLELYDGSSDHFKAYNGSKDLTGFWPETDIMFKLIVSVCNKDLYVVFAMPTKFKTTTKNKIEHIIVEAAALDTERPYNRPDIRTPRGMKKLK